MSILFDWFGTDAKKRVLFVSVEHYQAEDVFREGILFPFPIGKVELLDNLDQPMKLDLQTSMKARRHKTYITNVSYKLNKINDVHIDSKKCKELYSKNAYVEAININKVEEDVKLAIKPPKRKSSKGDSTSDGPLYMNRYAFITIPEFVVFCCDMCDMSQLSRFAEFIKYMHKQHHARCEGFHLFVFFEKTNDELEIEFDDENELCMLMDIELGAPVQSITYLNIQTSFQDISSSDKQWFVQLFAEFLELE